MGLRRLCFLLSVSCVLVVTGCGDNIHPGGPDDGKMKDTSGSGSDGSGSDGSGSGSDAGMDAPPCNSPKIMCGTQCIDPTNDNMHCGGCGTDCTAASQVCINSICCASGEINSNGHCCPSGDHYDNGICCAAGDTNIGGAANPLCCPDPNDINSNGHCCGAGQHYDNGICCTG